MEPLVEVHTEAEMTIALSCGAKVIGVNNRNLHTFQLDLETTERAIQVAQRAGISWRPSQTGESKADVTIVALSGISSASDVGIFRSLGVSCCLIGETLMKSTDPQFTIKELLSEQDVGFSYDPVVKICGMTTPDDVTVALQAGADLIGLIFVPGASRCVTNVQAVAIVETVRRYGERLDSGRVTSLDDHIAALRSDRVSSKLWFERMARKLRSISKRKPLVVGVFQNQSPEDINRIVNTTGIDIVQLHGEEDVSVIDAVIVPCIKVLHISAAEDRAGQNRESVLSDLRVAAEGFSQKALALMLDTKSSSGSGGTGKVFDWSVAKDIDFPVLIAGGLDHSNVQRAISSIHIIGTDVSSGVEADPAKYPGKKNKEKMWLYVKNARNAKNTLK